MRKKERKRKPNGVFAFEDSTEFSSPKLTYSTPTEASLVKTIE